MLTCIYCNKPLFHIRQMGYYYYCRDCAVAHDVDVLYSYSEPHKSFSIIHLGFSLNPIPRSYKFRVTISPLMQAMHVISLPYKKDRMMEYAVLEGKLRTIINPHIHIDRDAKIFEMPWNYLYTPQNVKTKIKNLLIFS